MTLNEFQSSIARTYKPDRAACHALGIAGEAGEVADLVKKALYHDEPELLITHPRREALRKELGDVLWYVAAVASDWGLSLNDVAQGNIDKLRERYPNGFVKGGGIREPRSAEDERKIELVKGLLSRGIEAMAQAHYEAMDRAEEALFRDVNPMSEKD